MQRGQSVSSKEYERSAWVQMRLRERVALRLYRGLMHLLPSAPVIAILRHRAARNAQRESAARVPERMALGLPPRPDGPLIWLNAIGPGDATALLPLIRAFLENDAATICVVTTRTASAQKVFARLEESARVIPQLAPLDTPAAMQRFLDHWRPTLAIFGEGDMWPNAVQMLKARGATIALVNGQMNGRLGKAFRKLPGVARWMAAHVDYLQVFTEAEAAEARPWFRPDCQIVVQPNLKMDAPPLPVSETITGAVRVQWPESTVRRALIGVTPSLFQFLQESAPLSDVKPSKCGAAHRSQTNKSGLVESIDNKNTIIQISNSAPVYKITRANIGDYKPIRIYIRK